MTDRILSIETKPGESYTFNGYTVTPFAQVISLRIPGFKGLAAWIRPVSVLVKNRADEERVIPIVDATRIAEWTLLGMGIAIPLLALLRLRRSRSA
jgi:hypothetical protein